ncbi:MAG: dTDP-4-dehydrorhamnose 3,5-epimerase, partial [Gaiellaceae bacterium]|nr:dTDP-4-dehydrorhamnose 3,5-epimerase [Gaiellaceae bacterium]
SAPYRPAAARGIRYDDPRLAIAWPLQPTVISARDRDLPALAA